MNFVPAFLIAGGLALLGAYWVYRRGRSFGLIAERIETMSVTPVARVAPGFVEVKGRVKGAGSLLTSPLSKKPCVYYHFLVEEQVKRGKSSAWIARINDEQECGLLVEDIHQGVIGVNVRAADRMLAPDAHTRSGFLNDAPPELEETLARYGGSSHGLIFNKTMRYTETVLEAGDQLHVLGTARVQGGKMVIDQGDDVFIVSDLPEERLTASFHQRKTVGYVLAGFLGLVGLGLCVLSLVTTLAG